MQLYRDRQSIHYFYLKIYEKTTPILLYLYRITTEGEPKRVRDHNIIHLVRLTRQFPNITGTAASQKTRFRFRDVHR